ncbi:hypothetical protein [Streptomyces sp. WG-D5]
MVRRIAAAVAVASVAGFLAAGPAVADVDHSSHDSGQVTTDTQLANQGFTNVGGPDGVTVATSTDFQQHLDAWGNSHWQADFPGH